MATSRPTRSLLQEVRVIDVPNENVAGYFLLLEMAFQTKRCVTFVQQPLVHGAVRRMADRTTLLHCFMWVDPGTSLLCVTLEARFVSAQECKATGFELLLNIRRRTFDRYPLVQLVTIGAAHFALRHRVMVRQLKRCANFQVTLEASFRRLPRIDDRTRSAAGFDMQTPGAVARFAAHVRDLL